MTDTRALAELAKSILRNAWGSSVGDIEVSEGLDHADQPALFFVVHMSENAPADLGKDFIEAHLRLRDALEAQDESRFPYLRTKHASSTYPENFILRYPEGPVAKRHWRRT